MKQPEKQAENLSTSSFHKVRDRRIHVRSWGEPSAPRLILLHGWGDVSASWQFMVDALSDGWHVVAPDWRGFGLSEWAHDAYWFPDYLADLDALLDAYSPDEPANLVGHSMGGNIASLYAGIRPERVARFANLEGIGLPRHTPDEAPQRYAQWLDQTKQTPSFRPYPSRAAFAERLCKENPRLTEARAAFLAQHLCEPLPPETVSPGDDIPDGAVRPAIDPWHRWTNPVLYRVEEAMACWRRVTAPMLWVAGAESVLFKRFFADASEDYHQRLACFATRKDVVLEDCGHNLHHDQPERLAQLIEAFFSSTHIP